MSSLTVRLTSPAGRSRIVLPSSSTLAELQVEVKTRCGVEPGDQQLSFDPAGNRPIDGPPSAQLSQLGFVNGSEVHLRNREASIAGQVSVHKYVYGPHNYHPAEGPSVPLKSDLAMGEHEATNLASRAFGMHKSGRDDCVGGAEASALPTIPTASITRVKCLDEHEFRKLLRFGREPSEESSGLPVDHVRGMVPEDPPKQARPPKQTLLRGSSAELDPARLGLLLLPPYKGDMQPRSKSGMWEKVLTKVPVSVEPEEPVAKSSSAGGAGPSAPPAPSSSSSSAPASSGSAPKAVESDGKKADPKFETFDAFLRKRQYDVGALPGNQKYVTVKITRGGMLKIPPSVSIKQQPFLDFVLSVSVRLTKPIPQT
ncbi:hypothetical protein AK812_SmicGene12687 [Symbiodinium microadriaticum]|uniref:Ubiquitin-like domain-containing protein n=1 Tax=Symbiodinium microadriaticum TaxID=2951 RepID=A0A1Q9EA57_SYMMI|nr:hypothetical protein AK812_SmicGene12687 [Symbiodinium microadriaticum]